LLNATDNITKNTVVKNKTDLYKKNKINI